ncbi:MAG: response regulator transcription factor [Limnochordales bacterium]|nr:response regulator transcription factor [Limnochordales bacterium]
MARILVVDDDPRLGALLRRSLGLAGHQVQVAGDGEAGLKAALADDPDLVILDWMLPGMDGLEVCRRLRAASDVPILMLTAKDAVENRVAGLKTGADDYLIKPFAVEELQARVEALLRRDRRRSRTDGNKEKEERPPEVLTFADLSLDTGTRTARRGNREIPLSTTEFELLSLFLRRPRQVLTRDLIMDRVWGYDFAGESNVLEVYIGYLRRKLEQGGEPRLIYTVRGAGYVLREPSSL